MISLLYCSNTPIQYPALIASDTEVICRLKAFFYLFSNISIASLQDLIRKEPSFVSNEFVLAFAGMIKKTDINIQNNFVVLICFIILIIFISGDVCVFNR